MRQYFVYIMTSRSRTLYVGVTNNIARRVLEHRTAATPGFTSRYRIQRLVYCESFPSIREAISAEKLIKGWRRQKKVALIESMNPAWEDLAELWALCPDGVEPERGPRPRGGSSADPSLRSG